MAERANSKKTQDVAPEVATLQKRGRRRLVGAIALVLLAVIILPMVLDPEPKPNAPLVSIRIPGEEGGKFTPKVAPRPSAPAPPAMDNKPPAIDNKPLAMVNKPPAIAAAVASASPPAVAAIAQSPAAPAAVQAEPVRPAEKATEKPVRKVIEAEKPARPAEKPTAKVLDKPVAQTPAGEQIVFQVGAFASIEKVAQIVDRLREAKLPHYTESVPTTSGEVTRVRLGPFASKDVAEKARERARALGLNPANIAPR
ncbi:MAG: hypothetical protein EXR29_09540 [Betaproteobacteria bacterium]|nr:hypothetical protein [Betaproteobacteria bacterium]